MDKLQRVKINDSTSISERPGTIPVTGVGQPVGLIAPAAPVAQRQWPSGCPCNSAPGPCENCSPAAEQPNGPDYCDGPEFEGWSARATEQPATVAVPRELLERLAGSPDLDPDCCVAYYRQQLRALLANK